MPNSNDFADSTDWLNTPLSALAPVEAALRCQVCKDFFTTPMITSCSHTFCSLCIRRYLSQEGRCPACRESDQEIKLRRNWSIEEAVTQFKLGREDILKIAKGAVESRDDDVRPKKRRKVDHSQNLPERRSTRSQSRKHASQDIQNGHIIPSSQEEIQDSDEGSVYEDQPMRTPKRSATPQDGLVACPCCGRRMKETTINAHLDKCIAGEATTPSPSRSNTPQTTTITTTAHQQQQQQSQRPSIAYGQTKPNQTQERLPTINYSMLNDNALRKKLKELGIPNHGSKELMRKRHTEWVNLWNANCDSLRPTTKQQLLRDLDRWEKTLGKQIDRGPSGIMVKEFDRDGWQKSNKSDFDDLIKRAREKKGTAAVVGNSGGDGTREEGEKVEQSDDDNDDAEKGATPMSIEAIFEGASSSGEQRLTNGVSQGKLVATGVLESRPNIEQVDLRRFKAVDMEHLPNANF